MNDVPLTSNPGGYIPVAGIWGRDELCATAWGVLNAQRILMAAERRTGKTCVMRKMAATPPDDWVVVSRDLEGLHAASDFATTIYEDVDKHLSRWKRTAGRARRLLSNLGGTEVGGVVKLPATQQTPWKQLLTRTVEDLIEQQREKKLVFFWDEVPFMLQGIANREGDAVAMEILDVLRSLRQQHPSFRMVLTGSVGLHHVLRELKGRGYANAPLNDVYEIEVPPLDSHHAEQLAAALIAGEQLQIDPAEETAMAIAQAADNIPFYIHHIVRQLKIQGSAASPSLVADVVSTQLLDANDPWSLGHYRERIRTYYPGSERPIVACLDVLALATAPMKTDEILKFVSSAIEFSNRNELLKWLRLLERDHYVKLNEQGFSWKFPLIARWWRMDRDL